MFSCLYIAGVVSAMGRLRWDINEHGNNNDMTDNDIHSIWESRSGDTLSSEELDRAFSRVMAKADDIENARERNNRRNSGRRTFFTVLVSSCAAAAVAAFVCIAALGTDAFRHSDTLAENAPVMREISTNNGQTMSLTLPDSSKVILNAGSTIIFPEKFTSSERSVYLLGEAIFDVTHDEDKPFTVNTSDLAISVHGTVFNVNSYPESASSAATLCEGSISAVLKSSGERILLVPDQRLSYDRMSSTARVTKVNSAEDTAWERGDLCFRSENIHGIARAIERKYGMTTYVTSGKYDDMILTAKFVHGETLEQMLGAICKLVPGMKYRIENDCVYIR